MYLSWLLMIQLYKEFFEYVNTFIKKNYYDIKTNTFYLI